MGAMLHGQLCAHNINNRCIVTRGKCIFSTKYLEVSKIMYIFAPLEM